MRRLREGLLARGNNPRAEMPFLDHLEELRWRILWSLLAVIVGALAGLFLVLYFDVAHLLMQPAREIFGPDFQLDTLAPQSSFFVLLQLTLVVGVVIASPLVLYQVWGFFSPALEKHEKRALVPALVLGLVLFVLGVAMGYFIALPITLEFFVGLLSDILQPAWTANFYFSFVVQLLVVFGLIFELPVVVLLLSVLGLITPAFLRSKRRHAIVALLVLASVLSPGDVILLTVLMTVPLILLYEFGILLSALTWRKRDRAADEADAGEEMDAPEDSVAAAPAEGPGETATSDPTPYSYGDPARKPETEEQ